MGSVSQIGWEWFSRLAKQTPTTLITHSRNRSALQGAGSPAPDAEIIYIDTEWFAGPLYRLSQRLFPTSEHSVFLVTSLDFFAFDAAALRAARRRMAAGASWDIVHQVTPVTTLAATRLHRLGLPVVRGPLNSGLTSPPGFEDIMQAESAWLYRVREIGRAFDAIAGSSRNAKKILVATHSTLDSLPRRYRSRCAVMLENGVDLDRFTPAPWPRQPGSDEPLRILFVGRLVPFKALPFLLDAVAAVRRETAVRLRIVGDGPMRAAWQSAAAARGLAEDVEFAGNRPLDQVAQDMHWAHVLCLPSVRESGGAVLLEAMASARPVIAVKFGGPAETVDDGVGRCLPPDSPTQIAAGFAEALRDIVRSPDAWRRRGAEGRRRAETQYGWDAKIEQGLHLYTDLLASSPRPRMHAPQPLAA